MTNKKKSIWFICCIFIVVLVVCLYFFLNPYQKASIIVLHHTDALTDMAVQIIEDKNATGHGFIGVHKINYWSNEETELVDFMCGGSGFGTNTNYAGFYYSPEDVPLGYQGTSMEFVQDGQGWSWEEKAGDNRYYTEKLCDKWYYYNMHF